MIGAKIIRLSEVDSTNNYAKGLVMHKEAEDGTVVLALCQKNGRGYANNSWESETGKNLTFSVVLSPYFVEPIRQFAISMVTALGITDFLIPLVEGVTIKWPNDIYIGHKKVAGMLIENMISGNSITESVIGIGFNLNQETFSDNLPNPISLKQLTQIDYDLENCLMHICLSIEKQYEKLSQGGINDLFSAYQERLYKKGIWADYLAGNKRFSGKILGVDEIGMLKVADKSGEILKFQFKEIEYLLPTDPSTGQ